MCSGREIKNMHKQQQDRAEYNDINAQTALMSHGTRRHIHFVAAVNDFVAPEQILKNGLHVGRKR